MKSKIKCDKETLFTHETCYYIEYSDSFLAALWEQKLKKDNELKYNINKDIKHDK